MYFSLSQYASRRSFIAILGSVMLLAITGCSHRSPPDVALISKKEVRHLRFSRIGIDMSDLKIQMPGEYYDLLGTSLNRALEKRFSQHMGGDNYRIIVRLTDLSLHMPPTREHEVDYNDYIDGEVYVLDSNNMLLIRKRVLMASTGYNSVIPWPTTSFSKKQLRLFANEYAAWVHKTLVGGPAT